MWHLIGIRERETDAFIISGQQHRITKKDKHSYPY